VWIKGQRNSKGQREGIWEYFYSNGNILLRIPYKEGELDGTQTFYDEQGNITETRNWKDGKLIEETKPELTPHIEYYPNGNVKVKGQKNSKGQEEGIEELFYGNGNIRIRTPYKGGKEDGIEEWFYDNGNIECRIPYKEGERDGIEEWFDKQGNITETRHWKDGEIIEETKH
jgi:antitoxin component YwqK of YwqJK toxin-antitoxin module